MTALAYCEVPVCDGVVRRSLDRLNSSLGYKTDQAFDDAIWIRALFCEVS